MKKDYCIIIDCQNDFVTGSLENKAARHLGLDISIYLAANKFDSIIFTRDTHYDNYLETFEGKNLPVKHCILGTDGWQIIPELKDIADESIVINKETFGFLKWEKYIKKPASITICGLVSEICVVSNVMILRAMFPETKIKVIEGLCAGLSAKGHFAAIDTMRACQVEIVKNDVKSFPTKEIREGYKSK